MIGVPEDSASVFSSGSDSLCRYTEAPVAFPNLFHKSDFNASLFLCSYQEGVKSITALVSNSVSPVTQGR